VSIRVVRCCSIVGTGTNGGGQQAFADALENADSRSTAEKRRMNNGSAVSGDRARDELPGGDNLQRDCG